MKCVILSLFPDAVSSYFDYSIVKRAREKSLLTLSFCSLRDFGVGKHRVTDDIPYGGGPGMVLKPEPIFSALDAMIKTHGKVRVIIPSPQGVVFDQAMALDFSREARTLLFICGRYEGIDERVREGIFAEEVSIGDYILTGGELPALVMIDAAVRLVPGVLGDHRSLEEESFENGLLEYPQYTRPAEFDGMKVPDVLRSGNHQAIAEWRKKAALYNTYQKRPQSRRVGGEKRSRG